jgi:FMN phosphatase YigB (HAD superfamily)
MPKQIILDIGNVLALTDFTPYFQYARTYFGIQDSKAFAFLEYIQVNQDLGRSKPIFNEFKDYFKIQVSQIEEKHFAKAYQGTLAPCHTALGHISKLVDDGRIQVSIMSNMGREHADHSREFLHRHNLLNRSKLFFSYKIGARKPELLFFDFVVRTAQELQGAIYLDDRTENINAGIAMGLNAKRFDLLDYYPLKSELDQDGRLNNQIIVRLNELLEIND